MAVGSRAAPQSPPVPFFESPFLPMQTHQHLINDEVTFKGCFPTLCSHSFCQKCVQASTWTLSLILPVWDIKCILKTPPAPKLCLTQSRCTEHCRVHLGCDPAHPQRLLLTSVAEDLLSSSMGNVINSAVESDTSLSFLPKAPSFSTHILTTSQLTYMCSWKSRMR